MTAEQQARDLLKRMGIENAQSYSAGEIVELANLINDENLRVSPEELEALEVVVGYGEDFIDECCAPGHEDFAHLETVKRLLRRLSRS